MKKLVYYSSAIIIISAFIFLFAVEDRGMFIVQLFASTMLMICLPICKEKLQYFITIFAAIWIVTFDIIYITLYMINPIDYIVSNRMLFYQVGIPCIVSWVLKRKHIAETKR